MRITRKQLEHIIKENLLLEFSPFEFTFKKRNAMLSFLTSFFNDDESGMIKAAKNIASYYNGDCDTMKSDIEEIFNSDKLISVMISLGTPIIKASGIKDKTIDSSLFDKILSKEVIGCDTDVINSFKKLGFKVAEELVLTGDFSDYQIAKDYKAKKFDYLKA
tara:strand:+ start:4603 stop:5088 length:486 start_codon:yes stop_codon:yes gene_type:complete